MKKAIKETVIVLLLLVGLAVFMFVLFSAIFAIVESLECNTLTKVNPDIDYQWTYWFGCMAKTPQGTWINASDYYVVESVGGRK